MAKAKGASWRDALLRIIKDAELWEHFPEGEVPDGEFIEYSDEPGDRFRVLVTRLATQYWLEDGKAGRLRALGGERFEFTIWRNRKMLDREILTGSEIWQARSMPPPAQAG